MKDIIAFFQQYESVIYFVLLAGIIIYSWRFYSAWQELRGSVFGLEQVNAQRRLNRSALAIFFMLILGVGVFSLISFVLPVIDTDEIIEPGVILGLEEEALGNGEQAGEEENSEEAVLATATPLPTVAVDPSACDIEHISISSPLPNQEISGVVEIVGVVNVEDFGFYVIEYAQAEAELWNPIFSSRVLVPEERTLLEWDTTFSPPGSYVIQLVVTDNDMEEFPPCRIPVRISN
jgi:hypothetical protein